MFDGPHSFSLPLKGVGSSLEDSSKSLIILSVCRSSPNFAISLRWLFIATYMGALHCRVILQACIIGYLIIWLYNRLVCLCRDLNRWASGLQIIKQRLCHWAYSPLIEINYFQTSKTKTNNPDFRIFSQQKHSKSITFDLSKFRMAPHSVQWKWYRRKVYLLSYIFFVMIQCKYLFFA